MASEDRISEGILVSFVRATRNREETVITELAFDVAVGRVPNATVKLERVVRIVNCHLGCMNLRHTELPTYFLPTFGEVSCTKREQAGCIYALGHLPDLPLHTSEVADRLVVLLALIRVCDSIRRDCPGDPDSTDGDVDASVDPPSLDIAFPFLTYQLVIRHLNIREDDFECLRAVCSKRIPHLVDLECFDWMRNALMLCGASSSGLVFAYVKTTSASR
jgi:hypothetical protein